MTRNQIKSFEQEEAGSIASLPRVSRRGFAAIGAVGAFAACTGVARAAATVTLNESRTTIATAHGAVDAWLVCPDNGRHPGVVMWPDGAGLRGSTMTAARRLAEQGFVVLVVDRTYQDAKIAELNSALRDGVEAVQLANRDARTFVAWLNSQTAVQPASARSGSDSGIGHGYQLRSVSAAPLRLSLATRAERTAAGQSGFLFALPEAAVARKPEQMAKITEAARQAYRPAVAA